METSTEWKARMKRSIAALIANTLDEQSQVNHDYVYVPVPRGGTKEDLTDVVLDGRFDLEALAEAVIREVRDDMIANPDVVA